MSEDWRPPEREEWDQLHQLAQAAGQWSVLPVPAHLGVSWGDPLCRPMQVNPGGPGHLPLLGTVVLLS